MFRKIFLALCFAPLIVFSNPISDLENKNNLVGQIHYKKWFFDVYDAELFAEDKTFSWDKPFLLKLSYLRDINGGAIANQTSKEIKKQSPSLTRNEQTQIKEFFTKCFPNIKANDVLYGYMDINNVGHIYNINGIELCEITDKYLAKSFFDIWLSDNASNLKLSRKLRGV